MERNAGNDGRQPMLVPGTHEKYSDAEQETLPRRNTVDLDEDRNRKIVNIKERRNKREFSRVYKSLYEVIWNFGFNLVNL